MANQQIGIIGQLPTTLVPQPVSGTNFAMEQGGNLAAMTKLLQALLQPLMTNRAWNLDAWTDSVQIRGDVRVDSILNPISFYTANGKTLKYPRVAQVAPGSLTLALADPQKKHKLLGGILTMSADGTIEFLDSVESLTGPMDCLQAGGFVCQPGLFPYAQTNDIGRDLLLNTTGGNANGVLVVLTEP